MAVTQPQTKVLHTLTVGKDVKKGSDIETKVGGGFRLGSPINGKNVGETFQATLTGKIEIREFQGVKGAYYTTKEGYSIRVNASFDPLKHKEGAVMDCICREFVQPDGGRTIKFTAFMD